MRWSPKRKVETRRRGRMMKAGSWGGWWYIHGGRGQSRIVIGESTVLQLHVSADERWTSGDARGNRRSWQGPKGSLRVASVTCHTPLTRSTLFISAVHP